MPRYNFDELYDKSGTEEALARMQKHIEEKYELKKTEGACYEFSEQYSANGDSIEVVRVIRETYHLKPSVVHSKGEEK